MFEISKATPTMTFVESYPSDQQSIGVSDLPGMHPSYRVNGRNFLQWSQLVRTFLKGRGMLGHLIGTPPKDLDPTFSAWDTEDSSIMSWIWSVMQSKVSKNFMFLTSARDIWEIMRQTYSIVQDASVIFENKTKISGTRPRGIHYN